MRKIPKLSPLCSQIANFSIELECLVIRTEAKTGVGGERGRERKVERRGGGGEGWVA